MNLAAIVDGYKDESNNIPDQTPCAKLGCRAPKWRHDNGEIAHQLEDKR